MLNAQDLFGQKDLSFYLAFIVYFIDSELFLSIFILAAKISEIFLALPNSKKTEKSKTVSINLSLTQVNVSAPLYFAPLHLVFVYIYNVI